MIRVAATGDVHMGIDSRGRLGPHLRHVGADADLLLIAGDLTKCGSAEEVRVLVDELQAVTIPRVAVLGNHDYHADEADKITAVLEDAGITVLEGSAVTITVGERRVGVAGTKGFGGGFPGASASEFGEPEMKAFVRHTKQLAIRLSTALDSIDADARVALMHYAPVEQTLEGERREIYPFLGSYLLAEAVDDVGADLVVHGHAHGGRERGITPGGVPVRNVAQPVLGTAYQVYTLGVDDR